MVVIAFMIAMVALSLIIWTKSLSFPLIFLAGTALFPLLWPVADQRLLKKSGKGMDGRKTAVLLASQAAVVVMILLLYRIAHAILFPGILLALIALTLLIWSIIKIAGRRKGSKRVDKRTIITLGASLLFINVIVSFLIMAYAGLSHSVRLGMLVLHKLLLSFMLIVICPMAALLLHRYYQTAGPENVKKAKRMAIGTGIILSFILLFLLGRLGLWPPLLFAARNNYINLEKLLIEIGADVNVRDRSDGAMPLQLAIWRNRIEMANLLIERGADVNAKSGNGWTVLMYAFSRGDTDMVKLLMDHGAAFHPKFRDGLMVMMNTLQRGDRQEIEVLLQREAKRNTMSPTQLKVQLTSAARRGHVEEVKELLEIGTDVNATDTIGSTALMEAEDHIELIQLLLDDGAEINARDINGDTALVKAAWRGQRETVRFLLKNGADVTFRNHYGKTALAFASEKKYEDVAKLLKIHGAKE